MSEETKENLVDENNENEVLDQGKKKELITVVKLTPQENNLSEQMDIEIPSQDIHQNVVVFQDRINFQQSNREVQPIQSLINIQNQSFQKKEHTQEQQEQLPEIKTEYLAKEISKIGPIQNNEEVPEMIIKHQIEDNQEYENKVFEDDENKKKLQRQQPRLKVSVSQGDIVDQKQNLDTSEIHQTQQHLQENNKSELGDIQNLMENMQENEQFKELVSMNQQLAKQNEQFQQELSYRDEQLRLLQQQFDQLKKEHQKFTNVEQEQGLYFPADVSSISTKTILLNNNKNFKDLTIQDVLTTTKQNPEVVQNLQDCWLLSVEKQLDKVGLFKQLESKLNSGSQKKRLSPINHYRKLLISKPLEQIKTKQNQTDPNKRQKPLDNSKEEEKKIPFSQKFSNSKQSTETQKIGQITPPPRIAKKQIDFSNKKAQLPFSQEPESPRFNQSQSHKKQEQQPRIKVNNQLKVQREILEKQLEKIKNDNFKIKSSPKNQQTVNMLYNSAEVKQENVADYGGEKKMKIVTQPETKNTTYLTPKGQNVVYQNGITFQSEKFPLLNQKQSYATQAKMKSKQQNIKQIQQSPGLIDIRQRHI